MNSRRLFDHLVGEHKQVMRNGEAERLCGRKIYDKLEFGRLLDWKFGRFGAAQNLIDQVGGAPEKVPEVCPIGHERPGLDMIAVTEDVRQPPRELKGDDARAVGVNKGSAHDVKCVCLGLERLEGGHNILRSPDFEWHDFNAEFASRVNLAHRQHRLGKANINHDCQPSEMGDNLAQKF